MEKEKNTARTRRIGAHLKRLRVERDISQEEAAFQFGIDTKTWQRFEQGAFLPSVEILISIHDLWDADISWLLFDTSFDVYDKRKKRSSNTISNAMFGPRDERK